MFELRLRSAEGVIHICSRSCYLRWWQGDSGRLFDRVDFYAGDLSFIAGITLYEFVECMENSNKNNSLEGLLRIFALIFTSTYSNLRFRACTLDIKLA